MTTKNPRLPLDEVIALIHSKLGADAARAIAAEYGPPPPLYSLRGVNEALDLELTNEQDPDRRVSREVGRVMAEFVRSSGAVKRSYVGFLHRCKESLQTAEAEGTLPLELPKPERQPREPREVSPELREQRLQAMAKARAVRSQRLAAAREAAATNAALDSTTPLVGTAVG